MKNETSMTYREAMREWDSRVDPIRARLRSNTWRLEEMSDGDDARRLRRENAMLKAQKRKIDAEYFRVWGVGYKEGAVSSGSPRALEAERLLPKSLARINVGENVIYVDAVGLFFHHYDV